VVFRSAAFALKNIRCAVVSDASQLVLSGDFFQLPPVPGRGQKEAKFAFEAETWNSCVGTPITLTRVFRQKAQGDLVRLKLRLFPPYTDPHLYSVR
jgi:hypothetical protein